MNTHRRPARAGTGRRRLQRLRGRDRGGISLFFAISSVAIFLLLAFVVDGAGKLRALNHAESAAQEAARTGAQAVNAGRAISGEGISVDRNAAQNAATAYLKQAGATGTVSWGADGSIIVSVTERYQPLLWPGSSTVTGRGSATLIVQGG